MVHVTSGTSTVFVDALEEDTTLSALKNEVGDVGDFGGSYVLVVDDASNGAPVSNPNLTLRDLAGPGSPTLKLIVVSVPQADIMLGMQEAAQQGAGAAQRGGRARWICGSSSSSPSSAGAWVIYGLLIAAAVGLAAAVAWSLMARRRGSRGRDSRRRSASRSGGSRG